MAATRFINIRYPFQDSDRGDFLQLNSSDQFAIKSDLMHLLLTRKGQRLYNPDFGCDLLKHIFEPNDTKSQSEIKDSVATAIQKYLPNLTITSLTVTPSEDSDYAVVIRIDYIISDDVFEIVDYVIIKI